MGSRATGITSRRSAVWLVWWLRSTRESPELGRFLGSRVTPETPRLGELRFVRLRSGDSSVAPTRKVVGFALGKSRPVRLRAGLKSGCVALCSLHVGPLSGDREHVPRLGLAAQPNEGVKVDATFVVLRSVLIHQPQGRSRGNAVKNKLVFQYR